MDVITWKFHQQIFQIRWTNFLVYSEVKWRADGVFKLETDMCEVKK